MDTAILRKAGLTESQAKGYLALIEHGELTPTQLAEYTGESRTNGYMVCEKLEKLGLATRGDGKKTIYRPTHPSSIESLAERRRKALVRSEQEVKQGISPLIDMFYKYREEPGARTLQGVSGIKEVFADVIRTGQDVYFIRTAVDIQTLTVDFYNVHSRERVASGIATYALTPISESSVRNFTSGNDQKNNFHRTFYPEKSYDAPVEIQVYGDKIAMIAYGDTQMATIITSPPLADSMRQIFKMLTYYLQEYSDKVKSEIHSAESQS